MPGWIAAAEALQLGKLPVSSTIEMNGAVTGALKSTDMMGNSIQYMPTLPGTISMAATLRKLVWPHVQLSGLQDAVLLEGVGANRLTNALLNIVIMLDSKIYEHSQSCSKDCIIITGITQESEESNNSNSSSRCSHLYVGTTNSINKHPSQHISFPSFGGSVSSKADHQNYDSDQTLSLLHQLQAIFLCTLSQVCVWRVEVAHFFTQAQPQMGGWLTTVVKELHTLHHTDLKQVLTPLLASTSMSQTRLSQSA